MLIRLSEAARRLGVRHYYLWSLVKRGDLEAVRLTPRGIWMVREEDVDRLARGILPRAKVTTREA